MTKETIEMTNKLIIPNGGQDDKSQEIFESLEGISEEEIMEAGEELEKAQKQSDEQQEGNDQQEGIDQQESKEQEETTAESAVFENIGIIGGDSVEYDQSNSMVKWRGNYYKVDDFQKVRILMDDLFKTGDTTGTIQIAGKIWL